MKTFRRTAVAAIGLGLFGLVVPIAAAAPTDTAKYYRCETNHMGETETRVIHLKVSPDGAFWHSERSPSSGPLNQFKETDVTYEWCDIACGEYVSHGRRYRAQPVILNKRSLGLSQVLDIWTPAGWDDRYLTGSCEREDGAHYEYSKPIID